MLTRELILEICQGVMSDPRHTHLTTAKHILRYLKATTDFGLFFQKEFSSRDRVLEVWSDSDWCGDQVERKSTHGYLFKYGGATISWCSRKQKVVALSSCEAEYIAASEAACQSVWLEAILDELKVEYRKPVQLLVDNKSAISLSRNPVSHGRSKHIETKFHYLRERVNQGKLELVFCPTEEQAADIFTKALRRGRFEKLRNLIGIRSLNSLV